MHNGPQGAAPPVGQRRAQRRFEIGLLHLLQAEHGRAAVVVAGPDHGVDLHHQRRMPRPLRAAVLWAWGLLALVLVEVALRQDVVADHAQLPSRALPRLLGRGRGLRLGLGLGLGLGQLMVGGEDPLARERAGSVAPVAAWLGFLVGRGGCGSPRLLLLLLLTRAAHRRRVRVVQPYRCRPSDLLPAAVRLAIFRDM